MVRRYLYIARHGETDWNSVGRWQGHTDIPLNDVGRSQARTLGPLLSESSVATIVSSDLSRAEETAAIVARALGIGPVRVDPALRERRYGVFEGLTREECQERHPERFREWMGGSHVLPPGAESNGALAARVVVAVRAVVDEFVAPGRAALIVTHGGSLRAILAETGTSDGLPIPNAALFRVECHGSALLPAVRIDTAERGRPGG